jgi:uncharacterized membrane protein YccC
MSERSTAVRPISRLDLAGVHFAVNIFVAGTLLWVTIREFEHLNPIWAISSMIATSEPKVEHALKFFRGRILNALIGCTTGLFILVVGGTSDWKIPLALSTSVLVSSYLIQVPVMWRQAPITATIVVAGGLGAHSKIQGIHVSDVQGVAGSRRGQVALILVLAAQRCGVDECPSARHSMLSHVRRDRRTCPLKMEAGFE